MTPSRALMGVAALCLALSLAGCDRTESILPGQREDIRNVLASESDQAAPADAAAQPDRQVPLSLPPARRNAEWRQSIASPGLGPEHPALSAEPALVWSVGIGAGDGRRNRITADPVVAGGTVFTLDAGAQVSAVSTDGALLWQTDLTPAADASGDATGGGLAYDSGQLFVSSGFGRLTALDARTGAEIWQQRLRASGTGRPTVKDGLVYLVAGDEVGWAIEADTGRIAWRLSASPDMKNVLGGPAPAVGEKYVVFAYGSGEVQGAFRRGGLRLWDSRVAGQRSGFAHARIGDITSDPVVVDDTVYVGNNSGRTVALNIANGARLWTATDGPLNTVWHAAGSLFMVTDRNEIVRLDASDGTRIWAESLSFFTDARPRRQSEIVAHYGPVIAGGTLIVASNDGMMRLFDPAEGNLRGTIEIPGGATTNPVVAGGTLYLVSTQGRLLAFR